MSVATYNQEDWQIGVAYQKQFGTKAKLTRSQIQNVLAGFGLWGEQYFRKEMIQHDKGRTRKT